MTEALRPARGYSWPPFQPGHTLAATHGAYSARMVAKKALELVASGDLPTLDQLADGPLPWLRSGDTWAVTAWWRAEARVVMLVDYLDRVGIEDDEGGIRESVIGLLLRAERAAADARDRLGLDPSARARLAKDSAAGALNGANALAAVAEAGRRAREAREATTPSIEEAHDA